MSRNPDTATDCETIAELTVSHDGLTLTQVIGRHPEVTVEITAQAPGTMEEWLLFFTAGDTDYREFERSIAEDPTVGEPSLVSELPGHRVYRVRVESGIHLAGVLGDLGFRVLQIESEGNGWRYRIQGPSKEALTTFFQYCEEAGISYELERLYETRTGEHDESEDISATDREALSLAHEGGYFEVPRRMTLDDLADALGVTRQTASERLRRAMDGLLDEHL
ncbi:helix-turn-helix domain-containing protein [Haloarchaeobius sp. TZWWS8]|uniref:helix-turn-helix domain-containing protein n=1 Tax=Haloarchaeobius sp. TZWWS8 TaxID=3446121 RepID=UPI003EBA4F7E